MFHLQCDLGSPRSGHLLTVAPEDVWLLQSKKFSLWTTLFLYWSTFVGVTEKQSGAALLMSYILHRLWDGSMHPYSQCMPFYSLFDEYNANYRWNQKTVKKKRQAFYKNHRGWISCLWLTLWKRGNNLFCQARSVLKLILTWQGSCWLADGWFISPPWFLEPSRNCSIGSVPKNSKLSYCPISTKAQRQNLKCEVTYTDAWQNFVCKIQSFQ